MANQSHFKILHSKILGESMAFLPTLCAKWHAISSMSFYANNSTYKSYYLVVALQRRFLSAIFGRRCTSSGTWSRVLQSWMSMRMRWMTWYLTESTFACKTKADLLAFASRSLHFLNQLSSQSINQHCLLLIAHDASCLKSSPFVTSTSPPLILDTELALCQHIPKV